MISNSWFSKDLILSFVVLFSKINPNDCLRVFHKDKLIDEIACDQKIKKIQVPIRYQTDTQFQMISYDNENICKFYLTTITLPFASANRFYFLYAKTKWGLASTSITNDHYMHHIDYYISLFGTQINGQIARPDFANKVAWKSDIRLQQDNTDKFWYDKVCGETFVKMPGLPIANYRPGFVCFYMNPRYKWFMLDIFDDVNLDLHNNKVQLAKATGKNINLPFDCVHKIKKISSEQDYLDVISDILGVWPALHLNVYKLGS